MSGTTIASATSVTLSLTTASQNPVLITAGGDIVTTGGSTDAILASAAVVWTITNDGVLAAGGIGVALLGAGTVSNSGSITGSTGVDVAAQNAGGVGTVTNFGAIAGTASTGSGVILNAGGTVSNGATDSTGWGITGAFDGVAIGGNGAVNNFGTITGSTANIIGTPGTGVSISGAASVVNGLGSTAGWLIQGAGGVLIGAGTVANDGTIRGTGGIGVEVIGSGTVANGGDTATGRAITGSTGVEVGAGAGGAVGTVTNFGAIAGTASTGYGVYLAGGGGGTVSNSGTISGALGVLVRGAGAVINSGTIFSTAGSTGTAVQFTGAALMVMTPGAVTQGIVAAANGAANTLELAGATAAGALTGLGAGFTNFTAVNVDAGADWNLTGSNSIASTATIGVGAGALLQIGGSLSGGTVVVGGGTVDLTGSAANTTFSLAGTADGTLVLGSIDPSLVFQPTITGFGLGDAIEVPVPVNGATIVGNGLVLTNNGTTELTLANVGYDVGAAGQPFVFGTAGGDSFVSIGPSAVACFATGTRIGTMGGDVAVEALRVGDTVLTAAGEVAPVIWIGHRHVDCRRHPRPEDVWPVRVAAHAFGLGRPRADVLLSPDHAVFVDDVLIPVRYLLNGATVRRETCRAVTYWHVELAGHDVILAEGLPCESYLDSGNRAAFANGGAVVAAHPDFARGVWAARGCAPLVTTGPARDMAYRRLLAQAYALGWRTVAAGETEVRWRKPRRARGAGACNKHIGQP